MDPRVRFDDKARKATPTRFQRARHSASDDFAERRTIRLQALLTYKYMVVRSRYESNDRFIGGNRDDHWGSLYRLVRGSQHSIEFPCINDGEKRGYSVRVLLSRGGISPISPSFGYNRCC